MSKISSKILIRTGCALIACWLVYRVVLITVFVFGSVQTDVVKRIQSPDRAKTALLIRRHALVDLNFLVKLKEGDSSKTLHFSRDFGANYFADWNEKLIWSDDSSFLVMSVDDINQDNEKYMWAYDFNDNKEYSDNTEIIKLLDLRNSSNTGSKYILDSEEK